MISLDEGEPRKMGQASSPDDLPQGNYNYRNKPALFFTEMRDHFASCKTAQEKKQVYRQLAQQLHPDSGGSTEAMQELNRQYWEALHGSEYLSENVDSEYAWYSSEGIEQALVDPRRPVIVMSINFASEYVGFCTIDCKTFWTIIVDVNEKAALKERSREVAPGDKRIGLTAQEFAAFYERRLRR